MLKLQIAWTLDTGETYEEWTIPFELALAEKEIYNGKPITTALRDAESPSNNLLLCASSPTSGGSSPPVWRSW